MDKAKIIIPSSSANVGLGFDIWCLGLEQPKLQVTYTRIKNGIEVETKSPYQPPSGLSLGYSGKKALENYLEVLGIDEGAHLLYEDDGYPVGGLGRSGAEAVGAVIAASLIYDKLNRDEIIVYSSKGEPGEHKDNVAASTNGRFNIIAISPLTGKPSAHFYDIPENLGIAIGYSSHKKTKGTKGLRQVLKEPVDAEDFIIQGGLVSAATAALISGNTNEFLEFVWGDRFHEPRRADVGGYGNFTSSEFYELKRKLFEEYHLALNVSGAGPNMQFLYNKDEYKDGIPNAILHTISQLFNEMGIELDIRETGIAKTGAYDYAQQKYDF
jgi:homoserine kinase